VGTSKIKRKLATLGVATAVMTGGIGIASVAPASAASMRCSFSLTDWWQDSRYERYQWDCYDRPVNDRIIYADFRGSDPWYDEEDQLYREYDAEYDFRWGTINDKLLNEDGNGEGDEIYIRLTLRRPNMSTYSITTNKLNRNYES
jgi:hypothetical protein